RRVTRPEPRRFVAMLSQQLVDDGLVVDADLNAGGRGRRRLGLVALGEYKCVQAIDLALAIGELRRRGVQPVTGPGDGSGVVVHLHRAVAVAASPPCFAGQLAVAPQLHAVAAGADLGVGWEAVDERGCPRLRLPVLEAVVKVDADDAAARREDEP